MGILRRENDLTYLLANVVLIVRQMLYEYWFETTISFYWYKSVLIEQYLVFHLVLCLTVEELYSLAVRQVGRWRGRQVDRWTGRQVDKWTGRQVDR
jgi:hypothetical protein